MLKKDPAMPDEAITLEYLCDELWFVGSPETVVRRISDLDTKVGGFGSLLTVSYDAKDERAGMGAKPAVVDQRGDAGLFLSCLRRSVRMSLYRLRDKQVRRHGGILR